MADIVVQIRQDMIDDSSAPKEMILNRLKQAGIPVNGNLGMGRKVKHGVLHPARDFDTDAVIYRWSPED